MTIHTHIYFQTTISFSVHIQSLHTEHYIKNAGSKAFLHKYTMLGPNLNLNLHPLTK